MKVKITIKSEEKKKKEKKKIRSGQIGALIMARAHNRKVGAVTCAGAGAEA